MFQHPQSSSPGIAIRRTASLPLAYVPVIHVLLAYLEKDVDGRDKPGHDELCKIESLGSMGPRCRGDDVGKGAAGGTERQKFQKNSSGHGSTIFHRSLPFLIFFISLVRPPLRLIHDFTVSG